MEYLGPKGCNDSYQFSLEQLLEMCLIIQRLQTKNFVHNNIKPSNFMIHHITGKLYLIDFEDAIFSTGYSHYTKYTKGFIAPERIEYNMCFEESDIFSLGILFVHQVRNRITNKIINCCLTH